MSSRSSLTYLICHTCSDFARVAVETECCGQIFCKTCVNINLTPLESECPKCGKLDFIYRSNHTARNLIDNITQSCPNSCGKSFKGVDIDTHLNECTLRTYYCKQKECNFAGFEDKFIQHMVEAHRRSVLDSLTEDIEKPLLSLQTVERPGSLSSEASSSTNSSPRSSGEIIASRSRSGSLTNGRFAIRNRDGNSATMGQNGKFYCGKIAEVLKRKRQSDQSLVMEKGPCGPDRGSNCPACMALDIGMRRLPYGLLLNQTGIVCKPVVCIHGDDQPRRGSIKPCRKEICGHSPIYYCERPHIQFKEGKRVLEEKCLGLSRCFACETLRYQLEMNMYTDVWDEGAQYLAIVE